MLNLVLTYRWYDAILSGKKNIEYRAMSPKWMRDIWQKRDQISEVRLQRAYTKTHMLKKVDKIDIGLCPYEGWDGAFIRLHLSSNKP